MTLKHLLNYLFLIICMLSLSACQAQDNQDSNDLPLSQAHLENFGVAQFNQLQKKLQDTNTDINIIQLGDSHTAGGYFSDELRRLILAPRSTQTGGWIPPLTIKAQRHHALKITSQDWSIIDSRRDSDPHFPLGGFIAQATQPNAKINLSLYKPKNTAHYLGIWLRRVDVNNPGALILTDDQQQHIELRIPASTQVNEWFYQRIKVRFPVQIEAQDLPNLEVGGYWLEPALEHTLPSRIISAVGANGAQIGLTQKWGADWGQQLAQINPDLIILAFGTNESMVYPSRVVEQAQQLRKTIQYLKKYRPESAILILGTPDFLPKQGKKDLDSICQPAHTAYYRELKAQQREIAKEMNTLFWDTALAMGGDCSIQLWQKHKLAQSDLIHLTAKGYQELANRLFIDLTH